MAKDRPIIKKAYDSSVSQWKVKLALGLRMVILLSGIYQTIWGELPIGIMILVAWLVITLPGLLTRERISYLPIEIELLLLVMVLFQLVIGEARDWYTNVPYYDKLVHYMFPVFMGLIGMMLMYTAYVTGKVVATLTWMAVLIIFVALGIGALWEIMEYLSDEILYPRIPGWHHFQGSLTEDALHDTMNDLIADTLGAITGAFLGVLFLRRAELRNPVRLHKIADEITSQLKK